MKLLFDENLSFRLVKQLAELFPGSEHVKQIGLESVGDDIIWNYAANNKFVIVSKDSDFHQKSLLLEAPPKVIWIKRGNCSTDQISELMHKHSSKIKEFGAEAISTFLVIE